MERDELAKSLWYEEQDEDSPVHFMGQSSINDMWEKFDTRKKELYRRLATHVLKLIREARIAGLKEACDIMQCDFDDVHERIRELQEVK
jgi:hypothetical protein